MREAAPEAACIDGRSASRCRGYAKVADEGSGGRMRELIERGIGKRHRTNRSVFPRRGIQSSPVSAGWCRRCASRRRRRAGGNGGDTRRPTEEASESQAGSIEPASVAHGRRTYIPYSYIPCARSVYILYSHVTAACARARVPSPRRKRRTVSAPSWCGNSSRYTT